MNASEEPCADNRVDCGQFETPTYFLVLMTSLNVVIFLAGLLGNVAVIGVLLKNRGLFETTGVFLLNLAVADLLVILIAQPTALMDLFTQEIWSSHPFLENTATTVSILTVLVISLERYIAICHPFRRCNTCLRDRQLATLLCLWTLAVFICLPLVFITTHKLSKFYDGRMVPVCRVTIEDQWKQVYIVGMVVVMYLVPVIVFAYLYSALIRRLSKDITPTGMDNDDCVFGDGSSRPSVSRARRKVIFMLIALITLLFMCVLPFRIVSLWMIYASKKSLLQLGIVGYLSLLRFPQILVYLHSAVNPIVYNVMSRRFRLALLRLLPAKPQCFQIRDESKSRV
ncbi:neuromedin-U receptor 2-like [Liolophura sinensis]|uniref:neuromedin-U receptor 2-like n=1 Tax=Liolophura sinensis TaxID=3198878 RepID=UPI0031588FC8